MMDEAQLRDTARQIVFDMVRTRVSDSDALISSGLIDSLSILRLISRLEERLGCTLPASTLQPEDFESVDEIVATVERCREGA